MSLYPEGLITIFNCGYAYPQIDRLCIRVVGLTTGEESEFEIWWALNTGVLIRDSTVSNVGEVLLPISPHF